MNPTLTFLGGCCLGAVAASAILAFSVQPSHDQAEIDRCTTLIARQALDLLDSASMADKVGCKLVLYDAYGDGGFGG